MRAIRQYEFGDPSVLLLEDVPDPEPGPGQVWIDVRAAGVHLIDTSIRAGRHGGWTGLPELPMTPGREVAGTVGGLGPDVGAEWLGRRVVAHLGQSGGGYAERAAAPVTALHALPDDLGHDAAVAMIGTGRTTVGILDEARLTADDVVLVTAAAGGIGTLLVQAAVRAGAVVVGAAGGPEKVALAGKLGADVPVDYSVPGWPDEVRSALGGREVTVALDGVGGVLGRQALELVGVGGRLVLFGFASGASTEVTVEDLFARGITVSAAIGAKIMKRAGGLRPLEDRALAAAGSGELVPVVGGHFPLARAADAHRAMEKRDTVGKVVLEP